MSRSLGLEKHLFDADGAVESVLQRIQRAGRGKPDNQRFSRGLADRLEQRTLFGIQSNIRDMVISKWSEFQLANKKDEEEGNAVSGEESWKKIVVAMILDGLGQRNDTEAIWNAH